jgi:predicted naringenin-chalcone synthase
MILQVCVELCTIHYQSDFNPETIVSNAIFADGAAAAVYAGRVPVRPPTSEIPGRCVELIATTSHVAADTLDRMSWRIGDTGFLMHLDAQIPAIMANAAREFVSNLARAGNAGLDDISKWAIHPGGRKIVEAVGESLGLGPTELQSSYSVLRNYGNMSSATILFVLERELARRQKTSELLACVAFGPGLTIEGALFHVR